MCDAKRVWIKDKNKTYSIPIDAIAGITINFGWGSLQNETEYGIDIYYSDTYKDAGTDVAHLVFMEHIDIVTIFHLLKDISLRQEVEIPDHLKDVIKIVVLEDCARYENRLFFTPTKFINLKTKNGVQQLPVQVMKNLKCERTASFNPPHVIVETCLTYKTPSEIPNHTVTHRVSLDSDIDVTELLLTIGSYAKPPFKHIPNSLKNIVTLVDVQGHCIIKANGEISIVDQYGDPCPLKITVDTLNGIRVYRNNLILYKNYEREVYVPFVHNEDLTQCVEFIVDEMKKHSSPMWVMNETHVVFGANSPSVVLSNIKDIDLSINAPTLMITCEHGIIPVPWNKPECGILAALTHWRSCQN